MAVGPAFGVEVVVVLALAVAVVPHEVQGRRQPDDEQVERPEDLGVDGVAIGFVADGTLIVGTFGAHDGEVAERDAAGAFRQPRLQHKAIMSVVDEPYLLRKQQYAQGDKVLWQLPEKEDGEEERAEHKAVKCLQLQKYAIFEKEAVFVRIYTPLSFSHHIK